MALVALLGDDFGVLGVEVIGVNHADGQVFPGRSDVPLIVVALGINGVTGVLRITSYNVCYTKLLRCWQCSAPARMGSR